MSGTAKRTVSLPEEQGAYIDAKVAAGDYASASEVVRAGLRALKERDEAVERWLVEEVAPTYDAMMADPDRGIPADEVWAAVEARHAAADGLRAASRGHTLGGLTLKALISKGRR